MSGVRILPLSAIPFVLAAMSFQKTDLPLRLEIVPKARGSCGFVVLRRDGTVAHTSPFAYTSVAAALAEGTEAIKQLTALMQTARL